MANKNPNTEKLIEVKKAQSLQKRRLVIKVLNEMIKNNEPISKAEICRRANVSKPFIYSKQNGLIDDINEAIINQNRNLRQNPVYKNGISDSSKDKVIESLKRKIKALELDNRRLKDENSILLGKLAAK